MSSIRYGNYIFGEHLKGAPELFCLALYHLSIAGFFLASRYWLLNFMYIYIHFGVQNWSYINFYWAFCAYRHCDSGKVILKKCWLILTMVGSKEPSLPGWSLSCYNINVLHLSGKSFLLDLTKTHPDSFFPSLKVQMSPGKNFTYNFIFSWSLTSHTYSLSRCFFWAHAVCQPLF